MPIHRWMASAAGGTSQRLKAGPATVRSLVKNPGEVATEDIGGSLRGAPSVSVLLGSSLRPKVPGLKTLVDLSEKRRTRSHRVLVMHCAQLSCRFAADRKRSAAARSAPLRK